MGNCIISANCQGVPLAKQLLNFEPFCKEFIPEYYVNFKKELIPPEKLQNCDLLIYQRLGEAWGELSEEYLLAHVNPRAKVICMPNMYHKSLWPISQGTGVLSTLYDETYVDELIARNLTVDEIVYLMKKVDLAEHYDLRAMFDEAIRIERSKKYLKCDELCDYIEEHFSERRLFSTYNHPYGSLLNLVAKYVLEEIGFSRVPECILPDISCDDEYFMPVHPSVIKFFNLQYIDEKTRYPAYGNMLDYFDYIRAYVVAKQNGFALAVFLYWLANNPVNPS